MFEMVTEGLKLSQIERFADNMYAFLENGSVVSEDSNLHLVILIRTWI